VMIITGDAWSGARRTWACLLVETSTASRARVDMSRPFHADIRSACGHCAVWDISRTELGGSFLTGLGLGRDTLPNTDIIRTM
jgi:hypothetical protein